MKSYYRAVVIGGGVVGASVLYHLTKLGWSEVALIERAELSAGSTWHAAAGFHALNADPNIAALQDYTIKLYRQLEAESGQNIGLHMTGGVNLAGTPERWEWLKSAWAIFQTMGIETARLVTPDEVKALSPITDVTGILGGLYDSNEGHLDPYGTTQAYVAAARKRGADLILRNRVIELRTRREGGWTLVTEQGSVDAEHVINAAGLWAKQVGLMAGVDLPVTPMQHHYLVTEPIAEVAALQKELALTVDLEGFTYLRQEGKGVLLGVYELDPRHWNMEGAPWDYGMELIPEEVDRIMPELAKGFERFPCLAKAGIKKWVNGAFTFTPDGNPLVGPVPGLRNYWVACGVMAGFSQGGGVGLSLAEWIVEGEPAQDVFGMDVARYGRFASNREYLKQTTGQFYKRRFVMTYPNEQLPAGRPLKSAPAYDLMTAEGAQWGASWGLELPLYFAPKGAPFVETPTLRRSNAFPIVAREAKAAREGVVMLDTSAFARYEVAGPGARNWLDRLLASKLPPEGRARLAPMLSFSGRLMGDLTVFNWGGERFWLMGSYYLRQWHMRWFIERSPGDGASIRDISDDVVGLAIAGPKSRELLSRITPSGVSNEALPFMSAVELDLGLIRAKVGRLSVVGELGYEFNVATSEHRTLYRTLLEAGAELGLTQIGYNAVNSLRLEKSFGIWSREFTWAYTPGMSGLDRFVAFEKAHFIGREAAQRERDRGTPKQRLVTLEVDTDDVDVSGFEPIWLGDRRVGFVTSGAYGHTVAKSIAMAYVDSATIDPSLNYEISVLGVRRPGRLVSEALHDPAGARLRM
jgi:dimethylglycine dehydrogenase